MHGLLKFSQMKRQIKRLTCNKESPEPGTAAAAKSPCFLCTSLLASCSYVHIKVPITLLSLNFSAKLAFAEQENMIAPYMEHDEAEMEEADDDDEDDRSGALSCGLGGKKRRLACTRSAS